MSRVGCAFHLGLVLLGLLQGQTGLASLRSSSRRHMQSGGTGIYELSPSLLRTSLLAFPFPLLILLLSFFPFFSCLITLAAYFL